MDCNYSGFFFLTSVLKYQELLLSLCQHHAWASHFKVLQQSLFVMGKAMSDELSCMRTGLVSRVVFSGIECDKIVGRTGK